MNIKVDFDNIVVKEEKNDTIVKILMLKGEKGDQGDGEPNVIEEVQVNGTALPVTNKTVNVSVPTVDSAISSSSTNPVQNSAIYNALSNKVDTSALDNYYQISEVDGLLDDKANTSALDNYYTKTQTYNKTEVDGLLNAKADASTIQGQITEINTTLGAKANSSDVASTYETKANHDASISNLSSQISSLASGSPLVASSISGMTDTTKVYVLTTDGHWYYYDGSAWADGGVYQASENSYTLTLLSDQFEEYKNGILPILNLLNPTTLESGKYYNNKNGVVEQKSASGYCTFAKFPVRAGFTYCLYENGSNEAGNIAKPFTFVCDNDGNILSSGMSGSNNHKINVVQDGYMYLTVTTQGGTSEQTYSNCVFVIEGYNKGSYTTFGEVYDYIILNDSFTKLANDVTNAISILEDMEYTQYNDIYVGSTRTYTTIASALASISDATSLNRYNILIDDGTYSEYSLTLPNYVNLIGASGNYENCIIAGYLEPSVTDNVHRNTSTIDLNSNNTLKNLTITAQNMRYPIHHESNGSVTDWETIVDNCYIEHLGNQEIIDYRQSHSIDVGNPWTSCHCWGEGASSGAKLTIKNTTLKSVENAFYVHGASNMTKPYYHELINCQIITSHENQIAVYVDNTTPTLDYNTLIIKDCYIGGRIAVVNSTVKYKCMVSGSGIKPVYQRPNHVCNDDEFPLFTDYMNEYIAGESIGKGTFVYTTDGRTVYKANSTTDKRLIVGYVIGSPSTGDLVKVSKGYLQPSSQTWPETPITSNKYYVLNSNGKLEETQNSQDAIAISNNYYYTLFI